MALAMSVCDSPQSITPEPHRRRPSCRGPTFTAFTPKLADSMIPLDELPTITAALLATLR